MPFDFAPSTEKAPSGELSLYERSLYESLKILRELVHWFQHRRPIMPFDNAPSTEKAPRGELPLYERLKILRELVPQSGDQGDFRTCLWSVARRDERLRAAGLAQYDQGHGNLPDDGVPDFLRRHFFLGSAPRPDETEIIDRSTTSIAPRG